MPRSIARSNGRGNLRSNGTTPRGALGLVLALALFDAVALAGSPTSLDWARLGTARTVSILHHDAQGASRATTIWVAVSEGQGYVRGGGGRWVGHTRRDGNVALRIGQEEFPVRATRVEDPAELDRVRQAFRTKYGFGDVLATMVRGTPTVFRLTPR